MKNKLLSVISDGLVISDTHTIQPNILIRTALFTPIAKNSNKSDDLTVVKHNVSDEFREIGRAHV